jgi:hypothetical protein
VAGSKKQEAGAGKQEAGAGIIGQLSFDSFHFSFWEKADAAGIIETTFAAEDERFFSK